MDSRSDVYAFALIVWEMVSRTRFEPDTSGREAGAHEELLSDPYRLPYDQEMSGKVYAEKGIRSIRYLVAHKSISPAKQEHWSTNNVMDVITYIMDLCWSQEPDTRPDLSLVLSKLESLQKKL